MLKTTTFLLLFFVTGEAYSQKESNTWYFGYNAGLNFNNTPPTILTNGQINTREGVCSISDKTTGQILFYSEGTTVWDKNHTPMPNGTGLLGDYSSTQSCIAIPNPGNSNKYYLFTTAVFNGMRYSEIDMTLNGGNGDVIAATKNTLLIAENESCEKLIAVIHYNKKDFWVVSHKLFSNSFVVYLVNSSGIQAPIIQNIGTVLGDANNWSGTGYLKFSADGSKLANTIGPDLIGVLSNVEVMNFNNITGMLSGPVVQLTGLDFPYGVEFSATNKFLYVTELIGRKIDQYNLNAPDINASKVVLYSSAELGYGALQMGPDGKIYVAAENGYTIGYQYLGRIDCPDITGAGCNYIRDAVNLGTGTALLGLPTFSANFLYWDTGSVSYTSACAGTAGIFSISNTNNIDSVKWDFGDASPPSILLSPPHTYSFPGIYNVSLIIYRPCNHIDTINKLVIVNSPASQIMTISICQGQNYSGYTTSGTYIDTLVAANGCDSVRTLNLTVKSISFSNITQSICFGQTYLGHNVSGIYIDTLVAANSCDSVRTLNLVVKPKSFLTITQTICSGQTYSGHSISGIYVDTLVATNGCDSIRTLQLTVLPKPAPNLGTDKEICSGDSLILYPGQFNSYLWQDGTTQNRITVKQSGLYSVIVTNSCGTARDEILVKEKVCEIYFPSAFTPNNDGKNDLFKILNAYNLKDFRLSVYNRWGEIVFETNDITKGWTGKVKGQQQDSGVFIWYCEFKKPGATNIIKMKGTVMLIR